MNENKKQEKCIRIIKNFLKEELNEELVGGEISYNQLDILFKYCLIKSAYSQEEWNDIIDKSQNYTKGYKGVRENEFPELINKYKEQFEGKEACDDLIRNKKFHENIKGDADRTQFVYAVYYLLWKESLKEKIDIEFVEDKINRIFLKFEGKEIECSGDTINTRDTICSLSNYKLVNNLKKRDDLNEIINIAEEFRWYYETLGNFMPMPVNDNYSLNKTRNSVLGDQFDLYLKEVQKFYKNNFEVCENDFFHEALVENVEYFKLFGKGNEGFENYLNNNYLMNYYDNNKKEVIELFKREKGQVLPKNEQIIDFFKSAKKLIVEKRAKIMKDKLFEIL